MVRQKLPGKSEMALERRCRHPQSMISLCATENWGRMSGLMTTPAEFLRLAHSPSEYNGLVDDGLGRTRSGESIKDGLARDLSTRSTRKTRCRIARGWHVPTGREAEYCSRWHRYLPDPGDTEPSAGLVQPWADGRTR